MRGSWLRLHPASPASARGEQSPIHASVVEASGSDPPLPELAEGRPAPSSVFAEHAATTAGPLAIATARTRCGATDFTPGALKQRMCQPLAPNDPVLESSFLGGPGATRVFRWDTECHNDPP